MHAKAAIQIRKPIEEVFEGIVDPSILTRYFISESDGRLESGVTRMWAFPEFEGAFPVEVVRVEAPHTIEFVWDSETVVTITLEARPDAGTVVRVVEDGKPDTPEAIEWAIGTTEGWANFLACMKAHLEYGINLRAGAFDFR